MSLAVSGVAPALNAYWGQSAGATLREVCDAGVNYATVSFINISPQNGNGYPGSNFGSFCGADYYTNNGTETKLLKGCTEIQQSIPYCQSKGVKVLLSIGGVATDTSNYTVSSDADGVEFAKFLYNAFGPYDPSWDGPRPFDVSETEHVSVDGFDLDLEDKSATFSSFTSVRTCSSPYVAMVGWWRQQTQKLFITAAPECVITRNGNVNHNDGLIANAQFDALFIQFYNNPVCDAIPGNLAGGGDEFSFDDWYTNIQSGKSKDAKVFIGLPANAETAAKSGYIAPPAMKDLVCQYSTHKGFGGISLWDGSLGLANVNASTSVSFLESAKEAVENLCNGTPTTSTTPSATPSSTMTGSSSTMTGSSSTMTGSSSTMTGSSSTMTGSSSTMTGSSSTMTGSSSTTSPSTTDTKTAPSGTFTIPAGNTSTNSYTSKATSSGGAVITSSSSHGLNSTATMTRSVSMTTSTVFTTSVSTITQCPPTVTNCPIGHVTTETIPLYTTVCPVTESPRPITTKASVMTTSTVYTTKTYTVTRCPPTVTNCPVGHVTTEVVPLYTTICPVGATQPGSSPQATGSAPAPVDQPSSLETWIRSTVAAQPTNVGDTGSSGCTSPECSGVAAPSGSWTPSALSPSSMPSAPVTAGASTLVLGLTTLIAVVAVQVLAM